jgi:DNA mismatch repair protein MutS
MSIFEQYFSITEKYKKDYGNNIILLMQVGGFYEMYGLHNNGTYINKHSSFKDICLYCGLKMTDKELGGEKYSESLSMAGFRTYSLDKYLKLIIEAGYVCVVYDQDEQKSGTSRSLQGVYTPGTFFDTDDTTLSNTLVCLWIHKYKNTIIIGASSINVLTGKSYVYEYERLYDFSPETFDELERFISTFSPNEIIIVHNIHSNSHEEFINLMNIPQKTRTSIINISNTERSNNSSENIQEKRAHNCSKQTYQEEIYRRFFGTKLSAKCETLFDENAIASQSYCFLLDYIYQNNPYLITNIELPIFENTSKRVILGNHSLKQLNIIKQSTTQNNQNRYSNSYIETYSDTNQIVKKRYSSICDLLNYCKTSMGSRLFHYIMTHPHCDSKLLNIIYKTTEYCTDTMKSKHYHDIISSLRNIYDIEKIKRKIYINRVAYDDIYKIYVSLKEISSIVALINTSDETKKQVNKYLNVQTSDSLDKIIDVSKKQQQYLESVFNKSILDDSREHSISIFNFGINDNVDEKTIRYYRSLYEMRVIYYYLVEQLKMAEKNKSKTKKDKIYKREPIKINETERGTLTFELTSARASLLSDYITREVKKHATDNKICICASKTDNKFHTRVLDDGIIPKYYLNNKAFIKKCFDDVYMDTQITFENSSSKGQKTINGTIINKVLKNTHFLKVELEESVKEYFIETLNTIKKTIDDYDVLIRFCSYIDMLMCYTTVAKNTNYCKPVIKSDENTSFCHFTNIRHPLIEHLLEDELYVANSIHFNSNDYREGGEFNSGQGFLLYGTNTVGKSSFIKSIGIAVIMAQCGFYVAAESMEYKPYTSIFTRILGNDDLFRGLSTFNVEMIELKNILNYADENSLVLGDEVCSGTEMGSASSIFMGALEHLYYKNTKFIFATHFHNIAECDEMISLKNMKNIHLSVKYDIEKDKLLYDRKLKEGAGENMYGLEVCKYLHLPDHFIKRSYELRNKYFSQNTSLLDLKQSKYNSKKLVGNCEKCGNKGTEVHHLQFQRNSDGKGFIKNSTLNQYFHKNQKANLMVLCDKCHDRLHSESDSGHYRVSGELSEIN